MFRFYWWVGAGLQPYTEGPRFNRVIAGVRELFWAKACGHDWRWGFKMARIYWRF